MTSNEVFQSTPEDNFYNNNNNNQLSQSENGGGQPSINANQSSESKRNSIKSRFLKLIDILLTSFFFTPCVAVFWVMHFFS
jgi:hypothetical protein